jgi:ESCRT-II complex subunit VPS25
MATTTITTATKLAPFPFPKIYNYPPFFTRQVNDRTWHAQLLNWSELILAYCRYYRIFTLDLKIPAETGSDNNKNEKRGELLFRNKKIGRTLKEEMLREIFEYMVSNGLAMWVDGEIDKKLLDDDTNLNETGGGDDEGEEDNAYERAYARYEQQHQKQLKFNGKNNTAAAIKSGIIVYWRRPQEWATLITDWVDETGQNGSVFTLYELVSRDAVQRQEFRGLHPAVLLQVVDVLVRRGRASVMKEGSTGLVAGLKIL